MQPSGELAQHRGGAFERSTLARRSGSVPSTRRGAQSNENQSRINVHGTERLASALVGGFALAWGLSERSLAGKALALVGGSLMYRGVSGHCPLYGALGVSSVDEDAQGGVLPLLHSQAPARHELVHSATILRAPDEVYAAWKRPDVLAKLMSHFAELESVGETRTRWTIRDPLGQTHQWETEIVEDDPGRALKWKSAEDAPLSSTGALELREASGERGTEVRLRMAFDRPSGALGQALAKLLGKVPSLLARRTLMNLKCLLEAGELPSLKKNPAARASAAL